MDETPDAHRPLPVIEPRRPRSSIVYDLDRPLLGGPDEGGLWVIWPRNHARGFDSQQENIQYFPQGLETFLEVEHKEKDFYQPSQPWQPRPQPLGDAEERKGLKDRAKDAAIRKLHHPLTVITYEDKEVWVILLTEKHPDMNPDDLNEELRGIFGQGTSVCVVRGASYNSLEGLADALSTTLQCLKSLPDQDGGCHVVEVDSGLESLLTSPKHSSDLDAFESSTLERLLNSDAKKNPILTRILCYRLLVHEMPSRIVEALKDKNEEPVVPATITNRLHDAEEILYRSLDSPTDKAELTLAAYLWYRQDDPEDLHRRHQKARQDLEERIKMKRRRRYRRDRETPKTFEG